MKVNGVHYRSIWYDYEKEKVLIIDQRWLPHDFRITQLECTNDFAVAIRDMWVRGAPLIGATAAYGMATAMAEDPSDENLEKSYQSLMETRPTAVNLRWALERCRRAMSALMPDERYEKALDLAHAIAEEDVKNNKRIGEYGLTLIKQIGAKKLSGEPVRILTHCNAGWPATVDWGTATSPMYHAHEAGIPIHIWVDETRPRNQGAMTAWELESHQDHLYNGQCWWSSHAAWYGGHGDRWNGPYDGTGRCL